MITLTPTQLRILASLIEKEATVPDTYPLTLNSLKNSCNQKSNRTPVMNLEEGNILHTLKDLKEMECVIVDSGGKALKYSHRLHKVLEIDRAKLAILTVLILRGQQTLNEIWTRSKRLYNFEDLESVQIDILQLIEDDFIVMLPKSKGVRENRYAHQLAGKIDIDSIKEEIIPKSAMELKIEKLENRVDNLQDNLDDLLDILKEKGIIND